VSARKNGKVTLSPQTKTRARETHKALASHMEAYGFKPIIGSEFEDYLFPEQRRLLRELDLKVPKLQEYLVQILPDDAYPEFQYFTSSPTSMVAKDPMSESINGTELLAHYISHSPSCHGIFDDIKEYKINIIFEKLGVPEELHGNRDAGFAWLNAQAAQIVPTYTEDERLNKYYELENIIKESDLPYSAQRRMIRMMGEAAHYEDSDILIRALPSDTIGRDFRESFIEQYDWLITAYFALERGLIEAESFHNVINECKAAANHCMRDHQDVDVRAAYSIAAFNTEISLEEENGQAYFVQRKTPLIDRVIGAHSKGFIPDDLAAIYLNMLSSGIEEYLWEMHGESIIWHMKEQGAGIGSLAAFTDILLNMPFDEVISLLREALHSPNPAMSDEEYQAMIEDILDVGMTQHLFEFYPVLEDDIICPPLNRQEPIEPFAVILAILEASGPDKMGFKGSPHDYEEWLGDITVQYMAVRDGNRALYEIAEGHNPSNRIRSATALLTKGLKSALNIDGAQGIFPNKKPIYNVTTEVGDLGNHYETITNPLTPTEAAIMAAVYDEHVDAYLEPLAFKKTARSTPKGQSRHQHFSITGPVDPSANFAEGEYPWLAQRDPQTPGDLLNLMHEFGAFTLRQEMIGEVLAVGSTLSAMLTQIPSNDRFAHEPKGWTSRNERSAAIRTEYDDRIELRAADATSYAYNRQSVLLMAAQMVMERHGLVPIFIHPSHHRVFKHLKDTGMPLDEAFVETTAKLVEQGVLPKSLIGFHPEGLVNAMEAGKRLTKEQAANLRQDGALMDAAQLAEIVNAAHPDLVDAYQGPFPQEGGEVRPLATYENSLETARQNHEIDTSLSEMLAGWQSVENYCPDLINKLGQQMYRSMQTDIEAGLNEFRNRGNNGR